MTSHARGREAARRLGKSFAGIVILPGEAPYDEARAVFNGAIDRRPAVIAQCAGVDDIRLALRAARAEELEVAVRGGGHGVTGSGVTDGGLVIDLRRLTAVTVDADARMARVAGGATWGDVDRATKPHRLVTTGGRVSTTGVAGLTLGGGSGWLERRFGFACDNLLAARLLTADGEEVTASEHEHPELFWALHGGGGNFGIATELAFRLHPLPHVTLALLLWPPEAGARVILRFRDLIESGVLAEAGGGIVYGTGSDRQPVPAELVGRLVLSVVVVFPGDAPSTRARIAGLLELRPAASLLVEIDYDELQGGRDDPFGFRCWWSAEHLERLPDEAIAAFCARVEDMPVPSPSQQVILPWGGAVARLAGDLPIANRHAGWCVHPYGLWADAEDDARGIAWARAVCRDMQPYAAGGAYLNFSADESAASRLAGFGGTDNMRRLAAIKACYDPSNVFRLNHNVEPQTHASAEPTA